MSWIPKAKRWNIEIIGSVWPLRATVWNHSRNLRRLPGCRKKYLITGKYFAFFFLFLVSQNIIYFNSFLVQISLLCANTQGSSPVAFSVSFMSNKQIEFTLFSMKTFQSRFFLLNFLKPALLTCQHSSSLLPLEVLCCIPPPTSLSCTVRINNTTRTPP